MSLRLLCLCQVECDMRNTKWKLCASASSQQLEEVLFFLEEMKINISFSSSSSLKIFLLLCFSTMNETTIVTATTTIIEWI